MPYHLRVHLLARLDIPADVAVCRLVGPVPTRVRLPAEHPRHVEGRRWESAAQRRMVVGGAAYVRRRRERPGEGAE